MTPYSAFFICIECPCLCMVPVSRRRPSMPGMLRLLAALTLATLTSTSLAATRERVKFDVRPTALLLSALLGAAPWRDGLGLTAADSPMQPEGAQPLVSALSAAAPLTHPARHYSASPDSPASPTSTADLLLTPSSLCPPPSCRSSPGATPFRKSTCARVEPAWRTCTEGCRSPSARRRVHRPRGQNTRARADGA